MALLDRTASVKTKKFFIILVPGVLSDKFKSVNAFVFDLKAKR